MIVMSREEYTEQEKQDWIEMAIYIDKNYKTNEIYEVPNSCKNCITHKTKGICNCTLGSKVIT